MLCQGLEILGSKMTIVGKKKYFSNATKRKQLWTNKSFWNLRDVVWTSLWLGDTMVKLAHSHFCLVLLVLVLHKNASVTCRYHFISTCIKPLNSRGKHLETPPPPLQQSKMHFLIKKERQWRKPADEIFVYQPLTRKTGLTHFGHAPQESSIPDPGKTIQKKTMHAWRKLHNSHTDPLPNPLLYRECLQ